MIIFLYGPDTYRSLQKLKEFKKKFITEVDSSGLNITALRSDNFNIEQFKKDLTTSPFLAKKRMIIVENIITKKISKETQKAILALLKQKEGKDNIIIFWEEGLTDGNTAHNPLYQHLALEKHAYCFDLLKNETLGYWYQNFLKNLKAHISPQALGRLIHLVGDDLWLASSEMEKLSAYCRDRTIDIKDVELLTSSKLEDNIFALTDSLGQKNKKMAHSIMHDLLTCGISEKDVLNKIIWHLKNLLMTKSYISNSESQNNSWDLAKKLQLHPFVAKKALAQARNFKEDELKKMYRELVDMDINIKTSQTQPKILLDLFISKIT